MAQFLFDRAAQFYRFIHRSIENAVIVPPAVFRPVEGNVRLAHDFQAIGPRFGGKGDPDADADMDVVTQNIEGAGDVLQDPAGEPVDILGSRVLEEDCEFIAAKAADRISVAGQSCEPYSKFADERIPRLMAKRVIDVLEAVEVEQQDGRPASPACQGMFEAVIE